MKARFANVCPECERPIHEGDEIADVSRFFGPPIWAHYECPPEPPRGTVCPDCHMERALDGSCECGL